MNVDETIRLVRAVSENGLASLKLKERELKLSSKRGKRMPQIVTISAPSADAVSMQMVVMQNGPIDPSMMSSAMMPQGAASPQITRDMASGADIGSDRVVTFPLVGTFYNASPPNAVPFVQAGDTVKKDQVLGITEAMKLMDETENEHGGVVRAVLVNNEEVVKYGQLLSRVK